MDLKEKQSLNKKTIISEALPGFHQMATWRRDFHRHPELAWTEFRTATRIVETLRQLGWRVRFGPEVTDDCARMGLPPTEVVDKEWKRALTWGADPAILEQMRGCFTGVVGEWDTGRPGPLVAMRFEMDALEVSEATDNAHRPHREEFSSVNAGVMHACGHDGHLATGLGVASALPTLQPYLAGRVRLIFQPAEEGARGAASMVAADILDDVNYLLGIHLGCNTHSIGQLVCGNKNFLASDKIDVLFQGVGAHAGLNPEQGRNALLAAATAAIHLHAIPRHGEGVSRINVGVLTAGRSRNTIPDFASMQIETRGINNRVNEFMKERVMQIINGASQMYGVKSSTTTTGKGCEAASDEPLAKIVLEVAQEIPLFNEPLLFCDFSDSEDFTEMMRRVQELGGMATHMSLGTNLAAGHHLPTFDFDEVVLPLGVELLVTLIWRLLAKNPEVMSGPQKNRLQR
ncbi:MAG: amidohydrolase [Firmicutes bacterium]|nr:amidohydrolase [Bacillota bacterium]